MALALVAFLSSSSGDSSGGDSSGGGGGGGGGNLNDARPSDSHGWGKESWRRSDTGFGTGTGTGAVESDTNTSPDQHHPRSVGAIGEKGKGGGVNEGGIES